MKSTTKKGTELSFQMRYKPAAAATVMLLASALAWPQAHTRQLGDYTLRSSTVSSENLPAETARAHGIERNPRRGIVNVTVLKNEAGIDKPVPARLQVQTLNLAGQRRDINMRPITAAGRISYLGVYEFVHGEVLDFTVTAQPENVGQPLDLTYRDRLWAQGDLPDFAPQR